MIGLVRWFVGVHIAFVADLLHESRKVAESRRR
jgi:hypothetical protein